MEGGRKRGREEGKDREVGWKQNEQQVSSKWQSSFSQTSRSDIFSLTSCFVLIIGGRLILGEEN